VFPEPVEASSKWKVSFRVEKMPIRDAGKMAPAIAHMCWTRLQDGDDPVLVVTDMRRGTIVATPLPSNGKPPRLLARLMNPCHVEPCDLDGDGRRDFIVADLGSYPPEDHHRGRVVWLRCREDQDTYEPIVLASGLGRVADVRPADFDSDGDIDIIAAVFGLNTTGQILYLRNDSIRGQPPRFKQITVDPRPGAIHVPPCDFNGDGHPDFVALISQETEQVTLFMNSAGSTHRETPFHMKTLWGAPDLTFGSSGLRLVDLDADHDPDILFTNGDTFDNSFVNPSHGVQWLENKGNLKFVYHRLTDLTGAYAATAGDLDGDGDLDVLAVTWLPVKVQPANVYERSLASVVALEQTEPGRFVRHTLERDETIHAVLEMADFDGDGDLDFAVGCHTLDQSGNLPYWIAVWWNESRAATGAQKDR